MPNNFERNFLTAAIKQLGAPYIWGGHGDWIWTPKGQADMQKIAGCPKGFDCAGLITACTLMAGGPDLTKTWNAQTMWDKLPEHDMFKPGPSLVLFGKSTKLISHVAINLGDCHLLLQAAGGDHTTVSYMDSVKRGACVMLGYQTRQDLLGYRSLYELENAKP